LLQAWHTQEDGSNGNMTNMTKLGIAVALGVVAFGMNIFILNSGKKPSNYIRVKSEMIAAGTRISDKDIEGIAIPGDAALQKSFIPFDDNGKGLVLGIAATRDYQQGDLILQRDLPKTTPPLDMLGPFRLLSVGESVVGSESEEGYRSSDNTITVAATAKKNGIGRYEFDDNTRRLLQIVDIARGRQAGPRDSRLRIVSVVLLGNNGSSENAADTGDSSSATAESDEGIEDDAGDNPEFDEDLEADLSLGELSLAPNEVAVIVPLENVKILPGILLQGNKIGFVIPAYQ
jgi:hypothetical protein